MAESQLTRNLERLFNAACDETLTAEDQAALEAALADDVELQDTYLAFCRMHSDLRQHAQSARSVQAALAGIRGEGDAKAENGKRKAESVLVSPRRRDWKAESVLVSPRRRDWLSQHITRKSIGVALVVTAAALLVMATMQVPLFMAEKADPSNEQPAEPIEFVARLIRVTKAEWQVATVENPVTSQSQQIKPGIKLYPGQKLLLAAGLAQFKFADGAEVTLHGPAEFEVRSRAECALDFGNLVAEAHTERSKGFVVQTPTTRVTDLSTEFAVSVARGGKTLVHVLTGKVTVGSDENDSAPLTLSEGQTAAVSTNQRPVVVELSDEFTGDIAKLRRYAIRAESFENVLDALPYQPLEGDLLDGLIAHSSLKSMEPLNRLTDSRATARYGQGADGRVLADANEPWVLTFDLAQAARENANITSLWHINEVRVFSYNTDARVFQDYDLAVSADGEAWETLAEHISNGRRGKEINLPSGQRPDYYHDYSVTRLVHADGAALAEPVRFVRFTFYGVAELGQAATFSRMPGVHHTSLYEIDVLGTAATELSPQESIEPAGAASP